MVRQKIHGGVLPMLLACIASLSSQQLATGAAVPPLGEIPRRFVRDRRRADDHK